MYKNLGYDEPIVLLSRGADFFTPVASVHSNVTAQLLQPGKTLRFHVHMLSGGGARSWYCVEQQLKAHQQAYSVVSMVFDSAPPVPQRNEANPAPFVEHIKSSWLHALLFGLMKTLLLSWGAIAWVFGLKHPVRLQYEAQILQSAAIPKLFLYSAADTIVPPRDVHDTMNDAKAIGTHVEEVDFVTSPHVCHYLQFPERYSAAVAAFLSRTLSANL
ncbi:hypothetical protein ACHHYP_07604 [Achlya hypogyna]|uniref:Transmembrane protein n=1 Tax=Achlya hypogyna TaxID=1202772 RepID=A0A1V9ZLN7_ACHHY|nr:hypothetical protein ACHHYP_07604 [Achlya hypogyna]